MLVHGLTVFVDIGVFKYIPLFIVFSAEFPLNIGEGGQGWKLNPNQTHSE